MLSEQQQRIMGYFIEEAKDHLNTIEQGLLNLKATIEDPEMANEMFRAAHSVKGGAAMLGLTSIQHTAHRLEDYFKVLKECSIRIDQRLETLLLRVYDTLGELLEHLQGPFGLTDDKAEAAMAGVEPVFAELNQMLSQLVSQSGNQPPEDVNLTAIPVVSPQVSPAPATLEESALRFIFQTDVPARLREMLQLFKQSDTAETRQQLQMLCQTLMQFGEQLDLPDWCELLELSEQAIATPDNTYRTLAPVVIKDIKRAQEQILAGQFNQITPSEDLIALVPFVADPHEAMTNAELADLLGATDSIDDEAFELFESAPTVETAASTQVDLSEFLATEASENLEFDFDAVASDSQLIREDAFDFSLIDQFDEPRPTLSDNQTGPEVGMAELNTLADLFEGEESDLSLDWQEEVISDFREPSEALDMDASHDFSDLLQPSDSHEPIQEETEDLSDLLNGIQSMPPAELEAADFDLDFTETPASSQIEPFPADIFAISDSANAAPAEVSQDQQSLDQLFSGLEDESISAPAESELVSEIDFSDLFAINAANSIAADRDNVGEDADRDDAAIESDLSFDLETADSAPVELTPNWQEPPDLLNVDRSPSDQLTEDDELAFIDEFSLETPEVTESDSSELADFAAELEIESDINPDATASELNLLDQLDFTAADEAAVEQLWQPESLEDPWEIAAETGESAAHDLDFFTLEQDAANSLDLSEFDLNELDPDELDPNELGLQVETAENQSLPVDNSVDALDLADRGAVAEPAADVTIDFGSAGQLEAESDELSFDTLFEASELEGLDQADVPSSMPLPPADFTSDEVILAEDANLERLDAVDEAAIAPEANSEAAMAEADLELEQFDESELETEPVFERLEGDAAADFDLNLFADSAADLELAELSSVDPATTADENWLTAESSSVVFEEPAIDSVNLAEFELPDDFAELDSSAAAPLENEAGSEPATASTEADINDLDHFFTLDASEATIESESDDLLSFSETEDSSERSAQSAWFSEPASDPSTADAVPFDLADFEDGVTSDLLLEDFSNLRSSDEADALFDLETDESELHQPTSSESIDLDLSQFSDPSSELASAEVNLFDFSNPTETEAVDLSEFPPGDTAVSNDETVELFGFSDSTETARNEELDLSELSEFDAESLHDADLDLTGFSSVSEPNSEASDEVDSNLFDFSDPAETASNIDSGLFGFSNSTETTRDEELDLSGLSEFDAELADGTELDLTGFSSVSEPNSEASDEASNLFDFSDSAETTSDTELDLTGFSSPSESNSEVLDEVDSNLFDFSDSTETAGNEESDLSELSEFDAELLHDTDLDLTGFSSVSEPNSEASNDLDPNLFDFSDSTETTSGTDSSLFEFSNSTEPARDEELNLSELSEFDAELADDTELDLTGFSSASELNSEASNDLDSNLFDFSDSTETANNTDFNLFDFSGSTETTSDTDSNLFDFSDSNETERDEELDLSDFSNANTELAATESELGSEFDRELLDLGQLNLEDNEADTVSTADTDDLVLDRVEGPQSDESVADSTADTFDQNFFGAESPDFDAAFNLLAEPDADLTADVSNASAPIDFDLDFSDLTAEDDAATREPTSLENANADLAEFDWGLINADEANQPTENSIDLSDTDLLGFDFEAADVNQSLESQTGDQTSNLEESIEENNLQDLEGFFAADLTSDAAEGNDLSFDDLDFSETATSENQIDLNILSIESEAGSETEFTEFDDLDLMLTEAESDTLFELDQSAVNQLAMDQLAENSSISAEPTAFDDLQAALADNAASITEIRPEPEAIFAVDSDISLDHDFADLDALLEGNAELVAEAEAPAETVAAEVDDEFGDLEALLQDADQALGVGASPARKSAATSNRRPNRRSGLTDQTMRVTVKHLDNLNNLVGEMVVNRNSLEQAQERLRQFLDNLLHQVQQLSDVGQRMRDLYERSLLESSLLSSRRGYHVPLSISGFNSNQSSHATGASFDALEMDRFTGFHTLSQEMIELIVRVRESASDIDFVVEESDQVTRNFRQITTQLQEGLTRSRMVPFAQTADRLPRGIRDNSLKYGKQAELLIEGRDTLIDKMIVEQLYDPMTHLVNNAIAHGIESPEERIAGGKPPTGRITIRAFHQGNQTVISVSDDGAGINPERVKEKAVAKGAITAAQAREMTALDVYDLLFHHGFSTADRVDDLRGRGVGLDVVRNNLNEIRGTIGIDSVIGQGTTFTIRLPLTLSISKALCCISNRARIAFPMDGVEDMLDVPKERIQIDEQGRHCIQWRDSRLPFQPLADLLRYNRVLGRGSVYGGNQEEDIISIVVLRSAGNFLALQVDQVLGEQEIVIKQLEGPIPKPLGVAGATVLGDGRIMPIADVLELIDLWQGRVRRDSTSSLWDKGEAQIPVEPVSKSEPTVLIVDDSITVRELLSMTFSKVGYRVEQARDGQEAWEKLRSGLPCDLVFCDIEMPRMDGLELLSRIQKDANLSHLPIAMLTSRGADRHRQMAVQLGAKGYFTKPYLEEVLLDAAQRMLKGEVMMSNANLQ